MEKLKEVYKRIWELKNQKVISVQSKMEIQKLQQSLDSAENLNKKNSAKFDTKELDNWLLNRYER